MRRLDVKGARFGSLVAQDDAGMRGRRRLIQCNCDCGRQAVVELANLRMGYTQSCGCIHPQAISIANATHGLSKTPIYFIWRNMLSRCNDNNAKCFKNYGGRGIGVCERWFSFENFYADMGEPPVGRSLDRINVNGNYDSSNCRWATAKEQARNKRTTLYFESNGTKTPLKTLCELEGVNYGTAWKRLKTGKHPFITNQLKEGV